MAQEHTLHIKVEPAVAEGLRELARSRNQTVAELVRQAIQACYQPDLLSLTDHQRRALAAFRGGYISLGKLAEELGMSLIDLRSWLAEHAISQNTCFSQDDANVA